MLWVAVRVGSEEFERGSCVAGPIQGHVCASVCQRVPTVPFSLSSHLVSPTLSLSKDSKMMFAKQGLLAIVAASECPHLLEEYLCSSLHPFLHPALLATQCAADFCPGWDKPVPQGGRPLTPVKHERIKSDYSGMEWHNHFTFRGGGSIDTDYLYELKPRRQLALAVYGGSADVVLKVQQAGRSDFTVYHIGAGAACSIGLWDADVGSIFVY